MQNTARFIIYIHETTAGVLDGWFGRVTFTSTSCKHYMVAAPPGTWVGRFEEINLEERFGDCADRIRKIEHSKSIRNSEMIIR